MITRNLASSIFQAQQRDFKKTCDRLSTGDLQMGFPLRKSVLNLTVTILRKKVLVEIPSVGFGLTRDQKPSEQ